MEVVRPRPSRAAAVRLYRVRRDVFLAAVFFLAVVFFLAAVFFLAVVFFLAADPPPSLNAIHAATRASSCFFAFLTAAT